jgi:broad specificity phosphatase PhoE
MNLKKMINNRKWRPNFKSLISSLLKRFIFILLIPLVSSCGHTYYIVRHAEKAQSSTGSTMATTNDPPLSDEGKKRAEALKTRLGTAHIRSIFSTNTVRTLSTVAPLSLHTGIKPEIYSRVDDGFLSKLKSLNGNVVIVGHSNTVDDIVNGLSGSEHVQGDLPDSVYNQLFILKSRGGKMKFRRVTYGD